jgi:hypothetical protein
MKANSIGVSLDNYSLQYIRMKANMGDSKKDNCGKFNRALWESKEISWGN